MNSDAAIAIKSKVQDTRKATMPKQSCLRWFLIIALTAGFDVFAQGQPAASDDANEAALSTPLPASLSMTPADRETSTVTEPAAPKPPAAGSARSAVVNLQTTVTGNQEQPRVLYILPWQSPESEAVEFDLLNSGQAAVFGHVERDELRRQLEAMGEFD